MTALDLITRALRQANILGEGQVPSGDQANDALAVLNDLIDGWNTDSLVLYQTTNDLVTTVPGQSVYTVGAGGNWVVDRPAQINSAYVEYEGVSYQVYEINQDEYNLLTLKSMTQVFPRFFLYLNTFPLGTLTLWPTPTLALPFTMSVDRVMPSIPNTGTTLSLPPGYSKALRTNLAVELCVEYGKEPPPTLVKLAVDSKADVKRANHVPTVAEFDPALIAAPGGLAGFLSGY